MPPPRISHRYESGWQDSLFEIFDEEDNGGLNEVDAMLLLAMTVERTNILLAEMLGDRRRFRRLQGRRKRDYLRED